MTEIVSEDMPWRFWMEALSGPPWPDSSVGSSLLSLAFILVELFHIYEKCYIYVRVCVYSERFHIKYLFTWRLQKKQQKEIFEEKGWEM